MSTHDTDGKPWAKLSELSEGSTVTLDGGFTCAKAGPKTIHNAGLGGLYFLCDQGRHYLDGQADDGEHLVGIYPL